MKGQQPSEPMDNSPHQEPFPPLVHGVRHSIYVIRTGLRLIRETLHQSADVQHLFKLVEQESAQLAEQIERLVRQRPRP